MSELEHKEGWAPKNWCSQTVVLEKSLKSPLDSKETNHLILKEMNPNYSLEGLMLKLKLQYFDHLIQRADSLEKTLMLGKIEGRRKVTKDELVGWHHWLNRHNFEQTPGDSEGQGTLVWCSLWGHVEPYMTERLNNNNMEGPQKVKNVTIPYDLAVPFLSFYLKKTKTNLKECLHPHVHWSLVYSTQDIEATFDGEEWVKKMWLCVYIHKHMYVKLYIIYIKGIFFDHI